MGTCVLPKDKQNLKNAIDLILMRPVLDKEDTYEELILANKWANKYVATGFKKIYDNFLHKAKKRGQRNRWLDKLVNIIFYIPQVIYMRT